MESEYRVAERIGDLGVKEFTVESRHKFGDSNFTDYGWHEVNCDVYSNLSSAKVAVFDLKEEYKRKAEIKYHYV